MIGPYTGRNTNEPEQQPQEHHDESQQDVLPQLLLEVPTQRESLLCQQRVYQCTTDCVAASVVLLLPPALLNVASL